jgi:hypothetical protein
VSLGELVNIETSFLVNHVGPVYCTYSLAKFVYFLPFESLIGMYFLS